MLASHMKFFLALLLLAQSAFGAGLKWELTTKRIEARTEERVVKTEFSYRNTGKVPVRLAASAEPPGTVGPSPSTE